MKSKKRTMRSWKTVLLDFGVSTVKIALYTSARKHNIYFRTSCKKCKKPLSRKYWCPKCEEFKDTEERIKKYEDLVFTKDEVKKAVPKRIEILMMTDRNKIDVRPRKKPYLACVKKDKDFGCKDKLYQYWIEKMLKKDLVTIAKVGTGTRDYLCIVYPKENYYLEIQPIFYGDEIVEVEDSEFERQELKEKEKMLAEKFFDKWLYNKDDVNEVIKEYEDEGYKRMKEIIMAKAEGKKIKPKEIKRKEPSQDLTKLLAGK